jgi:hypothetical protein
MGMSDYLSGAMKFGSGQLRHRGIPIELDTKCIRCSHTADMHLGMNEVCSEAQCQCRVFEPELKGKAFLVPGSSIGVTRELQEYLNEFEVTK